jgi:autotransporter-associated beta strand protein
LIAFSDKSSGETCTITLSGNAQLYVVDRNVHNTLTIGSLEGEGIVNLGSTIMGVGSNGKSTVLSGVVQDGDLFSGGVLTKLGQGTLTLSGSNLHTGGTTVSAGTLIVANTAGSATGLGTVTVKGGILGGKGIIGGTVTVGTGSGSGAFLAPAAGSSKQKTLSLQSTLTLQADATYIYTFSAKRTKALTDLVIANGVTINGATFNLSGQTQSRMRRGLTLTVMNNTSANPISGAFSNLPDGATVTVNGNNLQANYEGGDGNDLTLTVVP